MDKTEAGLRPSRSVLYLYVRLLATDHLPSAGHPGGTVSSVAPGVAGAKLTRSRHKRDHVPYRPIQTHEDGPRDNAVPYAQLVDIVDRVIGPTLW